MLVLAAVERTGHEMGRIAVLVIGAGYGQERSIDGSSMDELRGLRRDRTGFDRRAVPGAALGHPARGIPARTRGSA